MHAPVSPITGQHALVVGLEHRVADLDRQIHELRERSNRQTRSLQWLIGLLVTIGLAVSGLAYSAHSMLAARLIEVGTKQGETLARIEERLNGLEKRLDRER